LFQGIDMPFYEYQCKSCGHELEAMQKVSDTPLKKCPHCGKSQLQRLMSAPVFRLKGGGWYETDFKGDADNKRNLADRPESDAKDSEKTVEAKPKDDAKGDSKADTKVSDPKDKPVKEKAADAAPAKAPASTPSAGRSTAKRGAKKPAKKAAKPSPKAKARR
jgi:putative FmdB family regulatory protein